jgi:chorismate mutase/prephenate dehydrogenase
MNLDELRRQLDQLDQQLLQTIAARQSTSREIARVKRSTGHPTRDYGRERDVLLGARNYAQNLGVSPDVAETVMRLLIRSSLTTQERASVAATASGSGRRALVIGGAGKMGAWFTQFLGSQGFQVEVADPQALPGGPERLVDWNSSPLDHDLIVVAAPLGATDMILRELAQRKPRGVVFDLGSLCGTRCAAKRRRGGDLTASDVRPGYRTALGAPRDLYRSRECRGAAAGARTVRRHHG